MSKHTYRELIEAQLRGAIVQYDSEQDGHWRDLDYTIDVVLDELDEVPTKKYYRIKPKVRTVRYCNGVELPECVTEPLYEGCDYYTPDPSNEQTHPYNNWYWDGSLKTCRWHLESGFVYLDIRDAIAHARAMDIVEIKEVEE